MARASLRVELPREARKALEYFETEGTQEDRRDLADEVTQAILAARWRAASRRAVESARKSGRAPKGRMSERKIVELAVKTTRKPSSSSRSRKSPTK